MADATYRKVLGNFGPKPTVKDDSGKVWTFDWPGVEVIALMEKKAQDQSLAELKESAEYLSQAKYDAAAEEYRQQVKNRHWKGPSGPGFVAHYEGGTVAAFLDAMECMLLPNHPDITSEDVKKLLKEKTDDVMYIYSELMPAAAARAQASGPKANGNG